MVPTNPDVTMLQKWCGPSLSVTCVRECLIGFVLPALNLNSTLKR